MNVAAYASTTSPPPLREGREGNGATIGGGEDGGHGVSSGLGCTCKAAAIFQEQRVPPPQAFNAALTCPA